MLRILGIVLTRWMRPPLDLLDTSRMKLRVSLGDLDSNLHMNNGRYFSIADLGRFDQGLRAGFWKQALRRGWRPIAGDSNARYSASLRPFQRYELHTRLLGWDAKWFFAEHRFMLGARVAAVVVVRYLFVSKRGSVATALVLATIGYDQPSPELPRWAAQWRDAQTALAAQLKQESSTH